MFAILSPMRKVRVSILLREDLWVGFRSRGLTNLSGAMEEFLEAFLSSLPTEYRRRNAKETSELVRRFLEGRPVRESLSNPQELFQQFISFLQSQSLPSTPPQTQQTYQPPPPPSPQPQPQTQPQYQPPPQPKPTVQEQKPKPRVSVKEILRVAREHAIEHGVPPELVDYERILEEARREAEEEEEK
jgi:hypothetical protein